MSTPFASAAPPRANSSALSSAAAWAAVGVLASFVAWYLACVLHHTREEVADDAFITYRYARHFAEGLGLRYNASDAHPTWGASSWLHTLYSAGAIRAGLDPLLATRVLSLATFVLLAAAFGWTAARLTRAPAAACVFAALVVCGLWGAAPESATHLATGMDTLLFTLVHGLCACWAALALSQRAGRLFWLGAPLLALLVLARPEGAVLALGYALVVAWFTPRTSSAETRAPARGAWRTVAFVVAALVALGVAQWSYFGQPHANAYYVKVDSAIFGSAGAWLPGLDTTLRFTLLRVVPLALLLAALALALQLPRNVLASALALLAPALGVLVLYSRVIHEMAGGFRYEYPLLAPLLLALVVGWSALRERSLARARWSLAVAGLVAPLLASSNSPQWLVWLRHPRSSSTAWLRETPRANALARAGLDLAETGLGEGASVLLSAAGQAPYYSGWRAIDWIGLNTTRYCGRDALSVEQMWSELAAEQPDVVLSILPPAAPGSRTPDEDSNWRSENVQESLRGRGSALFKHWSQERLAEFFWREMVYLRDHTEFAAAYKLGDAWRSDWWVLVYVRRDSPHRERVLSSLRSSSRADRAPLLEQVFPFDPRQLGSRSAGWR